MNGSHYSTLRNIRAFQRKHLSLLESRVDYDLAVEIGYHQRWGRPLTLKQLVLLDIAPPATVQRRLKRLVSLGVVTKMLRPSDGRMVEFGISPEADRRFRRYAAWVGRCMNNDKPRRARGRNTMIRLLTLSRDEKVCGTCAHWEGARETEQGACQFVEDSEGVCRHLAETGRTFVDTLTLSTHRPACGQWKPCGS